MAANGSKRLFDHRNSESCMQCLTPLRLSERPAETTYEAHVACNCKVRCYSCYRFEDPTVNIDDFSCTLCSSSLRTICELCGEVTRVFNCGCGNSCAPCIEKKTGRFEVGDICPCCGVSFETQMLESFEVDDSDDDRYESEFPQPKILQGLRSFLQNNCVEIWGWQHRFDAICDDCLYEGDPTDPPSLLDSSRSSSCCDSDEDVNTPVFSPLPSRFDIPTPPPLPALPPCAPLTVSMPCPSSATSHPPPALPSFPPSLTSSASPCTGLGGSRVADLDPAPSAPGSGVNSAPSDFHTASSAPSTHTSPTPPVPPLRTTGPGGFSEAAASVFKDLRAQLNPLVCLKSKDPSAPSFALAPEAPCASSPSHLSPSPATSAKPSPVPPLGTTGIGGISKAAASVTKDLRAQLNPPVCLRSKDPSAPSFALAPVAPSASSLSHHSPSPATFATSPPVPPLGTTGLCGISEAASVTQDLSAQLNPPVCLKSKSAKRRARRKAKQSQHAVKEFVTKQPDYMVSGEWGESILTTPTTAPPNPREGEGVRKVLF